MKFNLGLISNIYLLILLVFLVSMTFVITRQVIYIYVIDYKHMILRRRTLSVLIDSRDYSVYYRILVLKKLWFEAIEFLELISLKVEDKDAYILNTLGFIYESLADYSLSEKYYLDATLSTPCYISAMKNLARIYIINKKENLAYSVYGKILDCDPDNIFAKKEYTRLVSKDSG